MLRGDSERRNAWLIWEQTDKATGYTIYAGTSPDKMYTNIMLYNANEYYFTAIDQDQIYYFQIEAFNENGIGQRSEIIKVE